MCDFCTVAETIDSLPSRHSDAVSLILTQQEDSRNGRTRIPVRKPARSNSRKLQAPFGARFYPKNANQLGFLAIVSYLCS